jgi:CheY-like chemotaxis protein
VIAKPLRILIVEDDALVRDVITMFLRGDRHELSVAANGQEGLDQFRAAPFDLVLTDRAMPEMTGEQLAVAIKKLNPSCPIILLTGFGDMLMTKQGPPEGVDLIVSKPFTLDNLREAVEKATSSLQPRAGE